MESDVGVLVVGGTIGAGSLLLAWALTRLTLALAELTALIACGVDLRIEKRTATVEGKDG